MPKKSIEETLNEVLDYWDASQQISFLKSVLPLFELYDFEDEKDWVAEEVGKENEGNVRMIRTIYLISKIAELHAGKLASFKMRFPFLWLRMEKEAAKEKS